MTPIYLRAMIALAALAFQPAAASEAAPRWEFNLDVSAERSRDGLLMSTPEAEAIFQWTERLHLTVAGGWLHAHPAQDVSAHGWGAGTVGFKWLLADDSRRRWSVALWPQYEKNLSSSSVRDGLASPHRVLAMPLELKFAATGFDVELIAGPSFSDAGGKAWNTELKLIYPCLPRTECTMVIERSAVDGEQAWTRVAPGAERRLTESLIVKAALGRDIGPTQAGRSNLVLTLGLKLLY